MRTAETDRITEFVLKVVRDMLNAPLPPSTPPGIPLGPGGLELESLSLVELTVHVEREYGIRFPDEAVDGLGTMTLGELVADIRSRAPGEGGTGEPPTPTLSDVKRLLVLSQIIPDSEPETIADNAEVVLDSLTLVWFAHQLKEQHGVELEVGHGQWDEVTSVAALHRRLLEHTGTAAKEATGR
ncbi:acyl carrier protein [Streptomyces sp. CNQ085]|uniref:acyl carrier protein n=1 Tax=Streptomyces sp. CNQ085 TaxID=2886944 RepID=UPI001F513985|nr:acyl carrier protein [Streptomyces sp. CNQ085]MCI0386306.1 acyl carrier protein [Streptomyces sp. CNQ085]